jgi:putative membrane protein insertion efficiency factor
MIGRVLAKPLIWMVIGYQATLSRVLPPSCRFEPSCSWYARGALERHGAFRGGWLAMRRLSRCRPFGGKGYDPVPE